MQDSRLPDMLDGTTILRDYGEITDVLKSRAFVTTRGDEAEARPFCERNLSAIDGDEHFRRRRIESRLFTNDALRYLEEHALLPILDQSFAAAANGRAADGTVRVELREFLIGMLYRVAATVAGIDGVDGPAQVARFNELIDRIHAGNAIAFARTGHAAIIETALAAREEFRRVFFEPSLSCRAEQVRLQQEGTLAADALPRDLITLLLASWDQTWDADLPLREVTLYLNASTRTMVRLALHVVDHVATWVAEHPGRRGDLSDGIFLRRAAAEALRLHAVLPAVVRRATADTVLGSGRRISAGQRVGLVLDGSNTDPHWFGADPEVFDPYRQERLAPSVPPWGTSFGGGAHMCIGRRMVTGGDWFAQGQQAGSERALDGTLITILLRLYRAGVEPDPDDPPVRDALTYYDTFSRYPARLTTL